MPGMIRPIDDQGRITLPIEMRRQYDMMCGDVAEIVGTDDGILLKTYYPKCVFCRGETRVEEHLGQPICANCRAHFKMLGSGNVQEYEP